MILITLDRSFLGAIWICDISDIIFGSESRTGTKPPSNGHAGNESGLVVRNCSGRVDWIVSLTI